MPFFRQKMSTMLPDQTKTLKSHIKGKHMDSTTSDKKTTDDREKFIESVTKMAASVYDFHDRFEMPKVSHEDDPDKYYRYLRDRAIQLMEEMGEFCGGLNKGMPLNTALEAGDIAFVGIGTLVALGNLGTASAITTSDKNDAKTLKTHMIDQFSGKLIRRPESV